MEKIDAKKLLIGIGLLISLSCLSNAQIPDLGKTVGIYARFGGSKSASIYQSSQSISPLYGCSGWGVFSTIKVRNSPSKIPIYYLKWELGYSSRTASFEYISQPIQITGKAIDLSIIVPLSFRTSEQMTANIGIGFNASYYLETKSYSNSALQPALNEDKFRGGLLGDLGFIVNSQNNYPSLFGIRIYSEVNGNYPYSEFTFYYGLSLKKKG